MVEIAYTNKCLSYERNLTFSIDNSIGQVEVACQTIPPKIYICFQNISHIWKDEFTGMIFIFTG